MQIILYGMTILYCMAIINLKGKLHRTCWGYLSVTKEPLDDHVHTPGNIQLIKICPPSTATYCILSDDDYQIVLTQFSLRGVHSLPPARQHTVQLHKFLFIWTCFFCLWPTRITSHAWILYHTCHQTLSHKTKILSLSPFNILKYSPTWFSLCASTLLNGHGVWQYRLLDLDYAAWLIKVFFGKDKH